MIELSKLSLSRNNFSLLFLSLKNLLNWIQKVKPTIEWKVLKKSKNFIFFSFKNFFQLTLLRQKWALLFLNSIFTEIFRNVSDKMKANRKFDMINRNLVSISTQY